MDLSVVPCRSHQLAGLPTSTSPPPLGERPRQSRRTMSHTDSHTMGDRSEEISEPPPPIRIDNGELAPTYDPSPDLAEFGPVISEIGPLHDRPTHPRSESPLTRYRYGMPKDTETHFEPASTSYGSYATSGFPAHDLTFHVESDFEPNTMPGGTLIPFHVERFGSTIHIAPSVLVVEATSYLPPRSGVSDPIRIPDPRRVRVGGSTYLITHIPSSSILSS